MLEVLTIFLGAFLVFLVQPLVGNVLLPVFGGTAAIWSACLAAFQILLVGGYFYAHLTSHPGVGTRRRLGIHAALLFMAACWLFCVAFNFRDMLGVLSSVDALPTACRALLCVTVLVAGPYILLSSNSSLVQVLSGGKYKLYAVSNLGSMLGLLAYPFVFELYLPLSEQWIAFGGLVAVYAVLFSILLLRRLRIPSSGHGDSTALAPDCQTGIRRHHPFPYFALSFVSCYLLNAVSMHLCTEITPLPMLWAGLLAVYLLSYILAFTDRGAQVAPRLAFVVAPLIFFAAWHFVKRGPGAFLAELSTGFALILLGGWIVHARLYRLRPPAAGLTQYYLMIAMGGAIGGATCSFLMPMLTNIVAEYPVALAAVLGVIVCDLREAVVEFSRRPGCRLFVARREDVQIKAFFDFLESLETPNACVKVLTFVFLAAFAICGIVHGHLSDGNVLRRYRNFYGLGYVASRTVGTDDADGYGVIEFVSCNTVHGAQVGAGKWRSFEPTTYYADHAGGLAIVKHPKRQAKKPMRVALCGLGVGTIAAYAQAGDLYRFYEINPAVEKIARDRSLFTFLSDASGTVEVVVDDARHALSCEVATSEPPYDVIIADVFNGDSIPPHMATAEAFRLYLDRLDQNGILAVHLSNWHLDLLPLVKVAAKEFGLNLESFVCRATRYAQPSRWAFLSRGPVSYLYDEKEHERADFSKVKDIPLMKDDHHSLLPYLCSGAMTFSL